MKEIEKMEENRDYLYDVVRNCIIAHTQCEKKDAEDATRDILDMVVKNKISIAQEIADLNDTLKAFRDDYRTAHGMNYEGGGGMFGGLFGRKK